ncbi:MAG: nucleotidyltransferase family protein, partial [Halobacteria archaeon]|nr:nucleotidyltransferase family protein [Halobacteria archaeon]
MKAVVLAAGEGTRLRPFTDNKPKALVEVGGKPLLSYCFDVLKPYVDEFVVTVGYKKEKIIEYYGDVYDDTPITYVHQREQKGLAHALLVAEPEIEDRFVVMNGDNVIRANVEDVINTGADVAFLVEELP